MRRCTTLPALAVLAAALTACGADGDPAEPEVTPPAVVRVFSPAPVPRTAAALALDLYGQAACQAVAAAQAAPSPAPGEISVAGEQFQILTLRAGVSALHSKTPGFGLAWAGLTAPTTSQAGLAARRLLCLQYGWAG